MDRIQLKEIYARLSEYDGKTVTVAGWAKTIRDSKAFGFIELNDGSCFKNMQIVFERASLDNYDEIAHENVGAALVVTGKGRRYARKQAALRNQGGNRGRGGRVRARLSLAEKASFRGIPARNRVSPPPHQPV